MAIGSFPTSRDIYIEVNGRKLAVAQSYQAKTTRESRSVEAFGSRDPVGTVAGRVQHRLELSRVALTGGDGINFYDLSDFNVVIVRPDRKIIYSGCQWASLGERLELGEPLLEKVTLVASGRMEV